MSEPIAVIGSGCRFPGNATSPSKLWELLKQPRDVQSKVPTHRFNTDLYHHHDGTKHGRTNAQHAYMIQEDIRAFDAGFFNIPPQEAEAIDPQHRLLLETVYEGLESAGLKVEHLQGSDTAVYVGLMFHDYQDLVNYDHEAIPTYAATGTAGSILSNRVSYFFDWHGPSMTIDTACSSSLVALHHAVQQLRSGSSKVAIAAGANLILSPIPFIVESKFNMLSPAGRSRMWDQGADGYARGEGVASVVLKTLSQALRDGDPIECVIRETGVNQDGKTAGITMPSHKAQETLIRDTYRRAGLDLSLEQSRCQYFEAHGTGTAAGDCNEAEAISSAFFGNKARCKGEEPLYVGSIKTIIGHTEGTAGIAGLIKVSLAVQHAIIPPNMLFENLSTRVAPFYRNLRIVTKSQVWPSLPPGVPRRASVNSFGFGGTNAHIIIESYKSSTQQAGLEGHSNMCALPIVLSASSEGSLKSTMENMLHFLKTNPDTQLIDLAWTLLQRRSVLSTRRSFSAQTIPAACDSLASEIAALDSKMGLATKTNVKHKPRILGIFTGQGAQYPAMGKLLFTSVPYAREIIAQLDESLRTLPPQYRPHWTLQEELMLEGDASRIGNSAFSQPLCCAVQILLVQMLRAAGIAFKAVIGHSSGEIACAFAAGYLSASQAIRTAHLRGMVSTIASSPSGEKGGMMAAGCSFADAQSLCDLEIFENRIGVAASNGPDSVTLSGDMDAILEAQIILEDEGKFTRLLKVDKAYHSKHMQPCAAPYVEALQACGCTDDIPQKSSTIWISSVHNGTRMSASDLTPEYWKQNLIAPVLFSEALEALLIEHSLMDVAIEVGPHPALKGPSLSVIEGSVGLQLPYTGCMKRGGNDLDSFANALGYIWEQFGIDGIDVDGFVKILPQAPRKNLAAALPRYPWDHSRSYWLESRATRAFLRNESGPPHPLLGILSPNSTASTFEWHNFLKPKDVEWLDGHQLQGQIVFPGAGYAVMALEATMFLAASMGDRHVRLLEIQHLDIEKAITFDDEDSLVEMNLTLEVDSPRRDAEVLIVQFKLSSCLARERSLSQSAGGQITVTFGPGSPDALPISRNEPPHMSGVSTDLFYNELAAVGYHYSKEFRGLRDLKRAESKACGAMILPKFEEGKYGLLLHPATLDVAFQTLIGASTAPGDGRLRSLLVPTSIGRISLNPWLCAQVYGARDSLNFNSVATASKGNVISGDIEVFEPGSRSTILQIEGISTKPARAPSAADDHQMFSNWVWDRLEPDTLLNDEQYRATEQERTVANDMERIVYFYIKRCLGKISGQKCVKLLPHYKIQVDWFRHIVSDIHEGRHLWYKDYWEKDTLTDILKLCELHAYHPHVRLIRRVGEHLDDIFADKRNAFDVMDHDGLLTEFYGDVLGFGPAYYYFQKHVAQVSHRYPCMDVLEIGAGTGGATKYVLGTEQFCFNSYTFTDISSSFFEKASRIFEQHEDRMEFRTLDIRRDPLEQGFKPQSYDMIIASNVLHATPRLEETLANARALLKPGGELVVIEITHRRHSRIGFIFGLFADWWAGKDEGRIHEPFVSLDRWDEIAKKVGFPGLSCRTVDPDSDIHPTSVWCARHVNDKILTLTEPLSAPLKAMESYPPIMVVGGSSPQTRSILEKVQTFLPHRCFINTKHLQDFAPPRSKSKATILYVSELDEPVFTHMNSKNFEALQRMFECAGSLLWVTENAWVEHPYQAMGIGFVRTMRLERTDIHLQVLDVDHAEDLDTKLVSEQLLRLEIGPDWSENEVLWINEPELYIKQNQVLIPRLKSDRAKNERLNSARRQILAGFNPAERPIGFFRNQDVSHLEAIERHDPNREPKTVYIQITVQHALASAIRVGDTGFFYIILGAEEETDQPVIALTQANHSKIQLPSTQVVHWPGLECPDARTLLRITASLIAKLVVPDNVSGRSLLIFEPPEFCTNAIVKRAKSGGFSVRFVSTHPSPAGVSDLWIKIHEKETCRVIAKKLPTSVSFFCDFSTKSGAVELANRLITCLPQTCLVHRRQYFAQESATTTPPGQLDDVLEHLMSAIDSANVLDASAVEAATPVSELVTSPQLHHISTVIDWQSQNPLLARVQPIDSGKLFVQDKTYLLVGLTGDLGRSICRWMIEHGACHVVLSSRKPKIEKRWIDDMADLGGNVMIVPMDVSDEASLDAGLMMIQRNSMPPIGGVAFGPLVLKDVLFENMEIAQMEAVLKPKVTGLRLLHERLTKCDLDFFVMFSSFVMVCGNPGQSAYGAANAYTHSVAQQRRARGLAGSTIDMGAIWGVGYIVRQGREEDYDLISFKFDKVSEQELHTLFAEAVVCGRPGTQEDVEVMTGMRFIDPGNRDVIPHYYDPRLGFFRLPERRRQAGAGGTSMISVKERLLHATSMSDVRQIINDGLAERIRTALALPIDNGIQVSIPLIDQGVDSLSAVTVGTWFSKNLDLDLPLLKILGGASVLELVEEAVDRIHPSAIPLAYEDGAEHNGSTSADSSEARPLSRQTSSYTGIETPMTERSSSPNNQKEGAVPEERERNRIEPISLCQEYCWRLQKSVDDPTKLNSTIGMYMQGYLDQERLSKAFSTALHRHEAFRTCFFDTKHTPRRSVQCIMDTPCNKFEAVEVEDRAAAEKAFKELTGQKYDLAKGDTLRIVDFYWAADEHIVTIAYHQMACDGWSYERLFLEVSQLYSGVELPPPTSQYSEFAKRQRSEYDTGRMDRDIEYWTLLYKEKPAVLPTMLLPGARKRTSPTWDQHILTTRLSPTIANRIKEQGQRYKATPFQFYLAAYHALLARLTASTQADIAIGVADANRSDRMEDLSTIGFFYNLLPLRFTYDTKEPFDKVLVTTKSQTRNALLHSKVPYGVVLDRLGVASVTDYAPLFQAMFDYKQGQAESGNIGEAHIVDVLADRLRTPYDITLDISDDPTKTPLLTFKLQKCLYTEDDVKIVMDSFVSLLSCVSIDVTVSIKDIELRSDQ